MQSDKQKQILGFFIEEAKEHLDTLEKGLLNLRSTVEDQEQLNEMFRAAHSVKGGAAMLGFTSIQEISHHLEDSFKVLKEHPIPADQQLESLFLKGYDALQDLLQRLQGPYGLREEEGEQIVEKAKPVFTQLQDYLDHLAAGGAPIEGETDDRKMPAKFSAQVTDLLREMLQLFKQNPDASNRQGLAEKCDRLASLAPDLETWQTIVQTAKDAIANSENTYVTLAPVIIKELKFAGDMAVLGKADEIAPSQILQLLTISTAQLKTAGKNQLILDLEPKMAAKQLIAALDKKQLTTLVKLLLPVVKSSASSKK